MADRVKPEELRLAEMFWRHEAEGVPALKSARDQHAFTDQSETTQAKWLGYARVALAAKPADDGVREASAEEMKERCARWVEFTGLHNKDNIARDIRALSTKAKP